MKTNLLLIGVIVAAALSFGAAAWDYFAGDLILALAVQDIRFSQWHGTMEVVSSVGKAMPMAVGAATVFCWLLWKRKKSEYLTVGLALIALGLNPLLKLLIERPRPTEDLVSVFGHFSGLSFPSGHAFTSMLMFGLLFYLAPLILKWQRAVYLTRIACLAMILLTGISRVYLGAHWPSDVLGGFLFGGIVLTLVISLHQRHLRRTNLA